MENVFKKAAYIGVGIASTAYDTVLDKMNELVKSGKISEDEGKKIVDDLVSDLDTKKGELETRFGNIVKKIVGSLDLPKRSDVHSLKAKIAEMEAQLADGTDTTPAKKPAAKKTSSAKKSAEV
jgi:polyhydroxyalkanoate synthesis regulator phasin